MKRLCLAAFVLLSGGAAAFAAPEKFDPCSLLTRREIEAVQGDRVVSTKASEPERGRFAVSQCFYSLSTFSKSISLEVTRRSVGESESPRAHWKQMFARALEKGGEGEKEGESQEKAGPEKVRAAAAKPRPVSGLGDEAYWVGSTLGGGLFVLKGDAYLRLSVGGSDSESVKTEKLKKLSRKALPRLR